MLITLDFPIAFPFPQDKKRYLIATVRGKYSKFKLLMEFISQINISEDASPGIQKAN